MKMEPKNAPARKKLEPAALTKLDQARARVLASGAPSLKSLMLRLGGWGTPEVSGKLKG